MPQPLEPKGDRAIRALTVSADGRWVYAGRQNGIVMIWSLESGHFVDEQSLHGDSVVALATDSATSLVVTSGNDATIKTAASGREPTRYVVALGVSRYADARDDLEALLASVPAREKLLLVDTCHAGEADRAAPPPRPTAPVPSSPSPSAAAVATRGARSTAPKPDLDRVLVEELFANLSYGSGAQVIVASTGAALEREGHGLFTSAVLEAIADRKAATDPRGRITVSMLRDYVRQKVASASGGRQTTVARRANDEFDFPVDQGAIRRSARAR